jgi:hypothetical protein
MVIPESAGGVNFLGGVTNLFAGITEAASRRSDKQRQDALFERKQGEIGIANKTELAINQFREQAADTIRNGQDEFGLGKFDQLPTVIKDEASELMKQRRAVQQGRATQDALDLKVEKFVQQMNTAYPEYAGFLGEYMRQNGFDHYLWRDQKLQDDLKTAGDKAQTEGYNQAVQLAVQSGYGNMNLSNDQLYEQGIRLHQAAIAAQQQEAAANAAHQAAVEGRENADWLLKRADRQVYSAGVAQIDANLGVLTDHLTNLVKATDNSDEAYLKLQGLQDDILNVFDRYGQHLVQNFEAKNASPDTIKALKDDIADRKKAVQDIFFGPSSKFGQSQRAYQYMQTQLGLSTEQALPFYMMAKRVLGSDLTLALFGGDPSKALSPQLMNKIRGELMSYDPTKPNAGMNVLAEIGALASGNVNLQDVPESQLTGDHMRGLNAAVKGAAEAIQSPEPDSPEQYSTFLGALGNLSIAGLRFTPGTKDLDALSWTLDSIASQNNLVVLDKLLKPTSPVRDKARSVFFATRQAAADVLESARTAGPNIDGQQLIMSSNGTFYVKNNQKIPKAVTGTSGRMIYMGSYDGNAPNASVNPKLQMQANVMNKAVQYLASTAHASPEYSGYQYQELVMHYAAGTPLKPKTEGGKVPKDVSKQIDEFQSELQGLNDRIEKDIPFASAPVSFKSPEDAIVRTVIGEAGRESDTGKKAVAAVILNRSRLSGMTPEQVVLAKGQFEPWATRSQELMNISEDSPEYQKALKLVQEVQSGEDPTDGATHFYAPELQRKLGRGKPGFDNGTGVAIGNHLFFKLGYKG